MTDSNHRLMLYQIGRLLVAVVVPSIFVASAYVAHSINSFYHPETYDPGTYWLNQAPFIALGLIAGIIIGFWKFRSQFVGKWVSIIGIGMLIVLLLALWSIL